MVARPRLRRASKRVGGWVGGSPTYLPGGGGGPGRGGLRGRGLLPALFILVICRLFLLTPLVVVPRPRGAQARRGRGGEGRAEEGEARTGGGEKGLVGEGVGWVGGWVIGCVSLIQQLGTYPCPDNGHREEGQGVGRRHPGWKSGWKNVPVCARPRSCGVVGCGVRERGCVGGLTRAER